MPNTADAVEVEEGQHGTSDKQVLESESKNDTDVLEPWTISAALTSTNDGAEVERGKTGTSKSKME